MSAWAAMGILLGACSGGDAPVSLPTTTPPPEATSTTSPLVGALPAGCPDGKVPSAAAVVAFVAGSRAWAVAPGDPSTLRCLFPVTDPGFFSWGPQGDRVVLSGLEVRGVGSGVARPHRDLRPSYFSWSRPTGTTVIFSDPAAATIQRADMGTDQVDNITPVPGVTYGDLAYHPSGLAIGFVASTPEGTGIWMSTNQGADPVQLVRADPATRFRHIVFAHDGTHLLYSVDLPDGSHHLARYDLNTGEVEPDLWSGAAGIADIVEMANTPGVALTLGTCQDRQAVFAALDGSSGVPLYPAVSDPTAVVGRLDADRFVVTVGGCDAPSELVVVSSSGTTPVHLVTGVTASAMRQPEPTPAPDLPTALPRSEYG